MPKKKKNRILLIDGDILLYTHAAACEQEVQWDEDTWSLWCDHKAVKEAVRHEIEELKEGLNATGYRMALSCPHNEGFRRQLCPTYKSNRDGKRKPAGFGELKKWAKEELRAESWPRIEADDLLGIWHTYGWEGEETVICSVDKDFRTVPGRFYHLKDGILENISEEAANLNHLIQTLSGDSSDGYSGCPGFGEKTARRLLEQFPAFERWDAVVLAYKDKGLTHADALLNARLAFILRAGHYNFKTNKIKLWNPY